jgi:hypothetical protein
LKRAFLSIRTMATHSSNYIKVWMTKVATHSSNQKTSWMTKAAFILLSFTLSKT